MARKKPQKKTLKKSHSFLKTLLWTFCFLALLLTLDQLALRLQPSTALLMELQSDYREFRSRLLGKTSPPLTIEAVINADSAPPGKKPSKTIIKEPLKAAPKKPLRATTKVFAPQPRQQQAAAAPTVNHYLYVDGEGELQFADRLEDIPAALRSGAQPLKD